MPVKRIKSTLKLEEDKDKHRTVRMKSVMTHAIETRTEATIIRDLLRITEMRTLRCIASNALCEIEFAIETSATRDSRYHKMGQNQETSVARSYKRDG